VSGIGRVGDRLSFGIEVFAEFADGQRVTDAAHTRRGLDLSPPMVTYVEGETAETDIPRSSQIQIEDLESHVVRALDGRSPEDRWGSLLGALHERGIATHTAELNELPFELELDEAARRLIARPQATMVAGVRRTHASDERRRTSSSARPPRA
jgi:hypothetical protein